MVSPLPHYIEPDHKFTVEATFYRSGRVKTLRINAQDSGHSMTPTLADRIVAICQTLVRSKPTEVQEEY
jgi:hypothetical protein